MDERPDLETTVPLTSGRHARRRERRTGLATVLSALAGEMGTWRNGALHAAFEEALCTLAAARAIRLRALGSAPSPHEAPASRVGEAIALEVPTGDRSRRAVLEALFDTNVAPDEWSLEMLESGAHLGALVLEAERGRLLTGYDRGARRDSDGAAPLIGSSQTMQKLRERVERVASTDFTVLIEGETGVGKELVARQLHELSKRRKGPFISINCAAIVESLLEAELFGIEDRSAADAQGHRGTLEHADGGTLFLDEVSDLSMSAQARLLRAVQDLAVERVGGVGLRRIDIRIVAATNRSLSEMVDRGLFRADLFYRLSGVEIRVPPLRSRREDVLDLARYFLARHQGREMLEVSPAVGDALLAYDWPGNVRELERLMEYAITLCESERIELDDLPTAIRGEYGRILGPSATDDDTMRTWGSRYARLVLERCGNNKRQACRVLGITYHTLQAYLRHAERVNTRSSPVTPRELDGEAVGT